MEVHKHPHHVTHKKKWTEYLLEFFMLFLAVFLGFVAENIRENISKHEREKELMVMMVEDLKTDVNKFDTSIKYNTIKLNKLDTLRHLVYSSANTPLPDTSIKKMYYLVRLYGGSRYLFNPTVRTLNQFDKNDAFRLIRKQEVSDSIVDYHDGEIQLVQQENVFNDFQIKAFETGDKIFNSELMERFLSRDSANAVLQSTQQFQLLSQDKQTLLLYGSKLFLARAVLFNFINQMEAQKAKAKSLSELIRKEYHLEKNE
ncbi:MAG: hypothetical protein M3004_04510 [Bacteroidota bacterium]|nr:hypothetical protein [Bacteroidota bacterium]